MVKAIRKQGGKIVAVKHESEAPKLYSANKVERIMNRMGVSFQEFQTLYLSDSERGPRGPRAPSEEEVQAVKQYRTNLEALARAFGYSWRDEEGKNAVMSKTKAKRKRILEWLLLNNQLEI